MSRLASHVTDVCDEQNTLVQLCSPECTHVSGSLARNLICWVFPFLNLPTTTEERNAGKHQAQCASLAAATMMEAAVKARAATAVRAVVTAVATWTAVFVELWLPAAVAVEVVAMTEALLLLPNALCTWNPSSCKVDPLPTAATTRQ
ncbi:hypothetical protein DVH05_021088 [Phytophthora capsici]|nr:hypothetical protein DVH05_021088 [Phytophthora capsici]